MSEMPDKIWAGADTSGKSYWFKPMEHVTFPVATEYVRADIYYALRTRFEAGATAEVQRLKHLNDNAVTRVAFLEKALEQAVQEMDDAVRVLAPNWVGDRLDWYQITDGELAAWLRGRDSHK